MNVKLRQLITKVPPRHVQPQQGEKEEEGVAQHKRSKELCSFVQQQLLQLCKDKERRRKKRISRPLCIFTQDHRAQKQSDPVMIFQWEVFDDFGFWYQEEGALPNKIKGLFQGANSSYEATTGAAQECRRWKPAEAHTDFKAGDTLSVFSGKKPCLADAGGVWFASGLFRSSLKPGARSESLPLLLLGLSDEEGQGYGREGEESRSCSWRHLSSAHEDTHSDTRRITQTLLSLIGSLANPPSLPLIHTLLSPRRRVAIHYRGSTSEGLGAAVSGSKKPSCMTSPATCSPEQMFQESDC